MTSFQEWRKKIETFVVSPSIVDEENPVVDGGENRGAFNFVSKAEEPPMPKKKGCGCKSNKFSKKK